MIVFGDDVATWVFQPHGGKIGGSAIGWQVDGVLKGGFAVEEWNKINCFVHIRLEGFIPKQFWFAMVDWVYNQLDCKRMTAPVASSNEKCLKLLKRMGWDEEAKLSESAYDGSDLIFMSWKKKDCFLLEWSKK